MFRRVQLLHLLHTNYATGGHSIYKTGCRCSASHCFALYSSGRKCLNAILCATASWCNKLQRPNVRNHMLVMLSVELHNPWILLFRWHAISLLARGPQDSCWYCNESGWYFWIYLLKNWTDLDKTWQKNGEWGKSDSVIFLATLLQKPQRGENTNLFRDEYHAPVWSLLSYRFSQNLECVNPSAG